jgi:hypothetical protein
MSPPHTCSHGPPQSAGFHLPTPGSGRSGMHCEGPCPLLPC